MAWQDPEDPDTKLRFSIRPLVKPGLVLKIWCVCLGVMFAVAPVGLLASVAMAAAPTEIGFWFKAALGIGLVFGICLFIARFRRVWEKVRR